MECSVLVNTEVHILSSSVVIAHRTYIRSYSDRVITVTHRTFSALGSVGTKERHSRLHFAAAENIQQLPMITVIRTFVPTKMHMHKDSYTHPCRKHF